MNFTRLNNDSLNSVADYIEQLNYYLDVMITNHNEPKRDAFIDVREVINKDLELIKKEIDLR